MLFSNLCELISCKQEEPKPGLPAAGFPNSTRDALQEFCLAASHDLVEPLRGAGCCLELFSRSVISKLTPEEARLLASTENSIAQLASLVAGLQELAKSGDPQLATGVVDADSVARKAVGLMDHAARAAGAAIEVDPLPVVKSNEFLLHQIFQNLLGNAIKYRAERPLEIHISCQREPEEWNFAVADNGIGIESQFLEYVFQPLKRLNRRRAPGAGLGLAVCRGAVRRLHGRIWAESTLGSGSTFHFTIPQSPGDHFHSASMH